MMMIVDNFLHSLFWPCMVTVIRMGCVVNGRVRIAVFVSEWCLVAMVFVDRHLLLMQIVLLRLSW